MPQKVTITKDKINGLLESQVTQPTDAVPLSMLNDLSGSIAIDISNIQTEIYDLSAYVYTLSGDPIDISDLSAVVYDLSTNVYIDISNIQTDVSDLSAVVYDLSTNVYIDISNIQTEFFDLSYYVYNDLSSGGGSINIGTYTDTSATIYPTITTLLFDASSFTLDLSGTSTIKIDIDVSGGSGEVTYSDLSYLLFDNPLISTNPQHSSTSSQVNLSWTPPTQTRSAFNFIDGGLATMNNTYSFLPYINDIWIKYSTTASYPVMGNSANITVANGAFKYSQITANTQRLTTVNKLTIVNTGTGSPTATLLGAPSNDTIQLDLTTGAIGGTYSYKIAYVNNSEDISWNYLTFGGQSFGNPGPANPPLSLSFTNITYSTLTVGGLGAAPPPTPLGVPSGMDASLNLPYGTPNFFVGYGVDISGVKRTGAIQVGGNTTDVPVTDISVGNLTSTLQTQAWSKNIDSLAAYPEYIINTINTPTKRYYAVNSSPDFSNRDISNVTNASAVAYIPIPTRSEAVTGTDYTTAITSLTTFALGSPTGGSITASPRKRGDVSIQITPVEFLSDLSSISYDSSNFYKLKANFGDALNVVSPPNTWVNSGSYLGSDATGISLTQFKVDISNGTSGISGESLSSSLISGVWTQGSNTSVSNSNISFSHSTTIPQGSGQLKEGYYLGVDLSSIKIIDISLGSFPDICNNTPSYTSYKASVTQILKKDGGSDQVGTTTAALFNIGKTPLNDTSVANYTITIFNPSYPSNNFWGLKLPTASGTGTTGGELVFKVDATINDLDQTWAPSDGQQAGSLYDLSLIYNPTSDFSSVPIENMEKSWADPTVETGAPASVALSEVMEMNYADDYTSSNVNFSRDVSGAPQFGIFFTLKNNIIKAISLPHTANISNTTDLSGIDGKNWWWDFTWNISAPSTNFPSTFLPPITDITSTTPTLMELVNVFDISSGQSTLTGYDHTNSINYNTAMWAKNGFYGAGLSSNVDLSGVQPYIDYNIYSGQGPSNVNYQIYDSSGITQNINYSPTVFYSNNAAPVTQSYTNLKFIIIRLSNSETSAPKSSYFIKCDIEDVNNNSMTLGTDYCLFYQEEQQSTLGTAVYQWASGSTQYFSPWLDCANKNLSNAFNTFQEGQAATTKGDRNGNYDAGQSTYHIRRIAQSQPIYQYLAIGIQNEKTIGKVTISYG